MGERGVTLLGFWGSPSALRVKWALNLKGVEYKYIEEDLSNKSPLLLQYNPVYKQIPVLVHDGKPLAESLVIIEYIDEVWKENPLLPKDPHERAKARFWAKFAEENCVPALMQTFTAEGEEKKKAAEETREKLKILEGGLQGKDFFGGEAVGFVDIAAGWLGIWARTTGQIVDENLTDAETMPSLCAWFDRFLELPIIKESIPPWDKLLELNRDFRHKTLMAAST